MVKTYKRRGELREATESLIQSLTVEIFQTEKYLNSLMAERELEKKKLEEQDKEG